MSQKPSKEEKARYRTVVRTAAAVAANAVLGSLATQTKTSWYQGLKKPKIQPPKWVFPLAWTALYADIATVVGQTLADLEEQGRDEDFADLKNALATNIVLNFGWSFLFFVAKKPFISTLEAGALAYSSAGLVRRAWEVDATRGKALLPYALWCLFAMILTFQLWRLNRRTRDQSSEE